MRRGQRPEIYRETVPDSATTTRASLGELSPLKRGTDSTRSASFRMSRGNRYDGGGGVQSPVEKPPRSASVEELSTAYLLKVNDGDSDHFAAEKTQSHGNSTSDLISIESGAFESDEWDDDDDDDVVEDAVLDVNLVPN